MKLTPSQLKTLQALRSGPKMISHNHGRRSVPIKAVNALMGLPVPLIEYGINAYFVRLTDAGRAAVVEGEGGA